MGVIDFVSDMTVIKSRGVCDLICDVYHVCDCHYRDCMSVDVVGCEVQYYTITQLLFDDGLGVVGGDCGDVRVRVNEFYLNLKSNTDIFYVEFTEFSHLECNSRSKYIFS